MSTESGTDAGAARRPAAGAAARSRASFAIVRRRRSPWSGLAGAAASVAQGPRVTDVQVDPAAAAAASGSRAHPHHHAVARRGRRRAR